MTSESRKHFEEWASRYGLRTDTVRKVGRLYDDFETQTAADAWSARDSEVERLREALSQVRTVIALQRDLIERGKHAAAWNPVISQIDAALSSQVKESK